jgi:hypothetical protein
MSPSQKDAEAVGRRVVGDLAPDELQYFDVAAQQFRRAPRRAPVGDVDDQLGFGVEIATALTPVVLWLSQVAIDAARKQVEDEVGGGVTAWITWAVGRLRTLFGGRVAEARPAADAAPALTPAEIRHVRAVVRSRAVEVAQLAPAQAERIADAIAAALIETA